MNALEIKNLAKRFSSFELNNISLQLPCGYIMGYIGQNGAGKTTTIKLIMEYLKKDGGEITVFGRKYEDDEAAYKNEIGYIADESYYPSSFTIGEVIGVNRDFYTSFDEKKFKTLIQKWQLPEKKKLKEFSKGMKMRLMLACVLSRETRLLLLDEPTSGLDPVMRTEVLEILQDYISDGKHSVLFSTHIMSDLEKISDFLCFIDNGKIVFNSTKDEILEGYQLVKGGLSDLTPALEGKMIGMKKTGIGFEGLLRTSDKLTAGRGVLTEKPSIDDIVVFHICGKKGVRV